MKPDEKDIAFLYEERAAILEFDAGMSREDAEFTAAKMFGIFDIKNLPVRKGEARTNLQRIPP